MTCQCSLWGRQSRKINKVTYREIYADVFILSQIRLLGSRGVECELHEGWAKRELFEGNMIIHGLAPHHHPRTHPSDFWLRFSLVHYQRHLSHFPAPPPPPVVPLFPCKGDVNFHVSMFLTSAWHMVQDTDTLLGLSVMLPFLTICFKSLDIYVLMNMLFCLIFIWSH